MIPTTIYNTSTSNSSTPPLTSPPLLSSPGSVSNDTTNNHNNRNYDDHFYLIDNNNLSKIHKRNNDKMPSIIKQSLCDNNDLINKKFDFKLKTQLPLPSPSSSSCLSSPSPDKRIFNEAVIESKRKTKSFNHIIDIASTEDITTAVTNTKTALTVASDSDEQINDKIRIDNNDDEFMEKTEDLIAKALKIALEEKKELFKKTELDKEDQYIDDEEDEEDHHQEQQQHNRRKYNSDNMMMPMSSPPPGVVTDAQGLIVPKKIINPCLESTDRQNLHRELMFNQKIGKNVLNQKSELQRALEKQKEKQLILQQKLQEEQEHGLKNELNRVIMERQQKLEKKSHGDNDDDDMNTHVNPEYLNARAKLRTRIDTK